MRPSAGWALAADAATVAAFVILGRDTHEAPFRVAETVRVAAPFLLALAVMWAVPSVRTRPWRLGAGVVAGAGTAFVGLALRFSVFGDGVSGAFPVVTFAFLTGGMAVLRAAVGWRRARAAA